MEVSLTTGSSTGVSGDLQEQSSGRRPPSSFGALASFKRTPKALFQNLERQGQGTNILIKPQTKNNKTKRKTLPR